MFMQKNIGNVVFWSAALAGSVGAGYASHEVLDKELIEPRVEHLKELDVALANCAGELDIQGVQNTVVPVLPDGCKAFANYWAISEYSETGSTTIVGYGVPLVSRITEKRQDIRSDQSSAEKAAIPLGVAVAGVTLFLIYEIRNNTQEFR